MAVMKLRVQLIIESDCDETEVVQEVAKLERHSLRLENLGLMLSEAKELLHDFQKAMVTYQTTRYLTQQISECGGIRSHKGRHQIVLRTLFGKLRLDSPRLYHCGCCSKEEHRSFSPLAELLPERTAPELAYLENKFAAMILLEGNRRIFMTLTGQRGTLAINETLKAKKAAERQL
jgi:hypothetical protein